VKQSTKQIKENEGKRLRATTFTIAKLKERCGTKEKSTI
jgi:hypothetical protein